MITDDFRDCHLSGIGVIFKRQHLQRGHCLSVSVGIDIILENFIADAGKDEHAVTFLNDISHLPHGFGSGNDGFLSGHTIRDFLRELSLLVDSVPVVVFLCAVVQPTLQFLESLPDFLFGNARTGHGKSRTASQRI